jgi:hypothetical protein
MSRAKGTVIRLQQDTFDMLARLKEKVEERLADNAAAAGSPVTRPIKMSFDSLINQIASTYERSFDKWPK